MRTLPQGNKLITNLNPGYSHHYDISLGDKEYPNQSLQIRAGTRPGLLAGCRTLGPDPERMSGATRTDCHTRLPQ
jgi:hypothetical protein